MNNNNKLFKTEESTAKKTIFILPFVFSIIVCLLIVIGLFYPTLAFRISSEADLQYYSFIKLVSSSASAFYSSCIILVCTTGLLHLIAMMISFSKRSIHFILIGSSSGSLSFASLLGLFPLFSNWFPYFLLICMALDIAFSFSTYYATLEKTFVNKLKILLIISLFIVLCVLFITLGILYISHR